MKILWTDIAWKDYLYWEKCDKKTLHRINKLIENIEHSPFSGLGKPEPLKFEPKGKWSRRIDGVHRIVYEVKKSNIIIYSCRYHY